MVLIVNVSGIQIEVETVFFGQMEEMSVPSEHERRGRLSQKVPVLSGHHLFVFEYYQRIGKHGASLLPRSLFLVFSEDLLLVWGWQSHGWIEQAIHILVLFFFI